LAVSDYDLSLLKVYIQRHGGQAQELTLPQWKSFHHAPVETTRDDVTHEIATADSTETFVENGNNVGTFEAETSTKPTSVDQPDAMINPLAKRRDGDSASKVAYHDTSDFV
jgi:hypothetical protein